MKVCRHLRLIIAVAISMASSLWAQDGYIGAIGTGTNALRYLKVARLSDLAGSPSNAQAQVDISATFSNVNDVAFLRSTSAGRLIAVLGNCKDFVPNEGYIDYRWRGYTHQLQGRVAVYAVSTVGDLFVSGPLRTIDFQHSVTAAALTVSSSYMAYQHFETWRLAGLAGGGFAVNVSDVRETWQGGNPDYYNPYNWLLAFDSSYAFRFRANLAAGYISAAGSVDAAGFINPYKESVASIWVGVSGTPTGRLRRYRIDWETGTLTEEAMLNGTAGWAYYMHGVAPLAYVGKDPVLTGGVVVREGPNACNASGNFANGNLDASRNWGKLTSVPGGNEVIGLNSDGTNLMVAFRSTNTNRLYRVAPNNGTYTDTGYSFAWTGNTWTVTASDGDAMSQSVIAPDIVQSGTTNPLAWQSVLGQTYQIETTTNLVLNDWQPYGAPLTGTGGLMTFDIPIASDPLRFFRVSTVFVSAAPTPTNMVLIPAGDFQMGNCMDAGEGSADELPVHTVHVSDFYIEKYEVTEAIGHAVAAWATANGYSFDYDYGLMLTRKGPNHPFRMTWLDAVKWCNARSQLEGLTPCYYMDAAHSQLYTSASIAPSNAWVKWNANGYRLPTEAEWEKAARGGVEGHRFAWGDAETISHTRANYNASSNLTYDLSYPDGYHPAHTNDGVTPHTSPVGSFAPNAAGLYDMCGNVWEWCWDRYIEDWYQMPDASADDPVASDGGLSNWVIRGGAWYDSADKTRIACRQPLWASTEAFLPGFRCVRR